MTKTETGLDWDVILRELKKQDWQKTIDGGRERLMFIGTVFSLYPSGKYYMPWACSNLAPCPACNGTGKTRSKQRRLLKKLTAAQKRCYAMAEKFKLTGKIEELQKHGWYRYHRSATTMLNRLHHATTCSNCGGLGSHEAYADEKFSVLLDKEASAHGLFVTTGEGDPCDIFVGESRDPMDIENDEE